EFLLLANGAEVFIVGRIDQNLAAGGVGYVPDAIRVHGNIDGQAHAAFAARTEVTQLSLGEIEDLQHGGNRVADVKFAALQSDPVRLGKRSVRFTGAHH